MCFAEQDPIIYLRGIRAGVYVAYYPVYVLKDMPEERSVMLGAEEIFRDPTMMTGDTRRYAERIAHERLDQLLFRAN
jgi:putative restriction endonuclease